MIGIYFLINMIDGKMYVGRNMYLASRISYHFVKLRKGVHQNKFLQEAFDRDGEESFTFGLLEECPKDMLVQCEQYWLDNITNKYNIVPYARGGGCWTEEHAQSVSLSLKGRIYLAEWVKKAADGHRGKPLSKTHKEKLSKVGKGRPHSQQHKEKIQESLKAFWAKKRDAV